MNEHNKSHSRQELEALSTSQLELLLRRQLEQDPADAAYVRTIIDILQNRDEGPCASLTPAAQAAWDKYQRRMEYSASMSTPKSFRTWKAIAAVALLALALLVFIPQPASAQSIFSRFISWTEDIFQFLIPEDTAVTPPEYTFRTDNPGLQQVYDTLTELDVFVPVVPMWLPDGYELTDIHVIPTPTQTSATATFQYGDDEIILTYYIYSQGTSHDYYCSDDTGQLYEKNGTAFYIIDNHDSQIVVWSQDKIECSLFASCRDVALRRIINSIYQMEESQCYNSNVLSVCFWSCPW